MNPKPKSPTPTTARQTGNKVSSESARLLALDGIFYFRPKENARLINVTRKVKAALASCVSQDQTKGPRLTVADVSDQPDWAWFRNLAGGVFDLGRRIVVESDGQKFPLIVHSIEGSREEVTVVLKGTMRPALKKGRAPKPRKAKRAKGRK